ncbi:dihydrofolate reductase family protein [Pseudomonas sp. RC3H12]|uniref:dihydrofolate reductase family protein n=1 Tax=Pseudomonas sp. RC3H12 TaxID=2834406 RepID=UPI001BDE97B6|nr:dihydrofolate reductase family protein [Pseudomonas sp. RC3H12]QWA27837.1 dihydrofolate reductase family protein [Pseudomonas sp. RC3H12]
MPLKASVFIASSLDGFIAREDGGLDWLMGATQSSDDHGYAGFMAGVDTLVMGRGTFDKVMTFGEWPYPDTRVVVVSSTLEALPRGVSGRVELHPGPIPALLEHLQATGAKSLYLDGGKLIQGFLREGLVDELTITRIPVLLGQGIPLFGELAKDVLLQHMRTTSYESGFVQSTYRVVR